MDINKVMTALDNNGMKPYYAEDKARALAIVEGLLTDGCTVAVGGSVSLSQLGALELLRSGRYNFLDRYAPGLTSGELREVFLKSVRADAYLCSANAITEDGVLFNVDGNSNRVGAIAYGPASVIVVAGINKIVPDLEAAVYRAKTVAAPLNAKRLNSDTYCRETGRCLYADAGIAGMTLGCGNAGRICCNYLVSAKQRQKDRIRVILVNEELGY